MSRTGHSGWIGVDLDGTLARYDGFKGVDHIGEPIPLMVARVRKWLAKGENVRIFTARMHGHGLGGQDVVTPIEQWCEKHLGKKLPVTCSKDFGMLELWDDRAIQIIPNTGLRADGRDQ